VPEDLQLRAYAATHVGRVRSTNEDSHLVLPHVAVVADGMGGHASGEVASELAVSAFRALEGRTPLRAEDVVATVTDANSAIMAEAAARAEPDGMGTTLTGVALVEADGAPHWLVLNVGDSRVYRLSPGRAEQLTVDHSEVAEMVARGWISPEEARVHPLRNVVTRSLGFAPDPTPDTWLFPVAVDDLFLVCSDGLTGELEDAEIARIVSTEPTLADLPGRLVDAAVDAGGRDNVTVVVVATG